MVEIVTDSAAHMPPDKVREYGIKVVPLQVIFGNETFRDGVEITNDQFYEMLQTNKNHPTTSQPSPADFVEAYRPLLEAGKEIVSIHLPSKLSGTYASACAAKTQLEQEFRKALPVTIIDTPWISLALGMLCMAAAQAAAAGKSRDEVTAIVNALIPKLNIIFLLDTLEYLRRGGRIGGAKALLGSLLNVKPMLQLQDGQVEPLEQPRSRKKGMVRLLEIMAERTGGKPVHVGVLHAHVPAEAELLAKQVRERFTVKDLYTTEIGPVIGVHVGPCAVGLAFYPDS